MIHILLIYTSYIGQWCYIRQHLYIYRYPTQSCTITSTVSLIFKKTWNP